MYLSPELCSEVLGRQVSRLEQKLLRALEERIPSADPAIEARIKGYLQLTFLTEQSASRLHNLIDSAGHAQQDLHQSSNAFSMARDSAKNEMRKWEQLRADCELAADSTSLSQRTTRDFRARAQSATSEYDTAVAAHDRALQGQLHALLLGSQILQETEKHARLEEDAVELWMHATSRALSLIEDKDCDCALWATDGGERERIARELDAFNDGTILNLAG